MSRQYKRKTPELLQLFKSNLQALGMARTAEVKRDARIGEKNLSEMKKKLSF